MSDRQDDLDKTMPTDFSQLPAGSVESAGSEGAPSAPVHSEQTAATVRSSAEANIGANSSDAETLVTSLQGGGGVSGVNEDLTVTLGAQVPMQTAGAPSGTPQIPGYEILCILGEGGMGVVYEARQLALQRTVALKVLKPAVAAELEFRERFLREAAAAGKVNDPHVVQIFDAGEADGHLYMTFELVRGGDLSQLLKAKGIISEFKALGIIRECALGLKAIEAAGLVHRDIKPGNIFMENGRRAVIGDLGLARQTSGDDRMTMTGASMGTPSYMSPEHISGIADVDIRTDIYALGSTLYKMLTGEEPFQGETVFAITHSILSQPIPDPRVLNPSLSSPVIGVVRKAMAKDRDDRYRNSEQLIQDIDAAMAGHQLVHAEGFGKIEGLPKEVASDTAADAVDASRAKSKSKHGAFAASRARPSALLLWAKPAMFIGILVYFIYLIPILMETGSSRWNPDWAQLSGTDSYGRFVDLQMGDQSVRFRLVRGLGDRGDFVMGSEASEKGFQDFEAMRAVKIDKEFWLGESEVTQAQWDEIMSEADMPEYQNSYYPMHDITWNEAQTFCARLNKRMAETPSDMIFHARLPSEAEWEFACRTLRKKSHSYGDQDVYEAIGHCAAGDIQTLWEKWWKDRGETEDQMLGEIDALIAERLEKNPHDKNYLPALVKSKQPNRWGLYDMIGNVGEWCADAWDAESPYRKNQTGAFRVVRGGSWSEHPWRCRAASRLAMEPDTSSVYVGLRILIDIPSSKK